MALALRKEEGLGLGIAIAAHVALVAVLLLRPHNAPVVKPPERIEVTISDQAAPTSTSPEPKSQAAPDEAPTLGEPKPQEQAEPAETEPEPAPEPPAPTPPRPAPPKPTPPKPEPPKPAPPKPTPPKPTPRPQPVPRKVERPTPRPVPRPPEPPRENVRPKPARPTPARPAPARPAPARPVVKAPAARPPARPTPPRAPANRPAATSASKSPRASQSQGAAKSPPARAPAKSNTPAGGSKIGSDFLAGVTGAKPADRANTNAPAATIGPAVKASLASSISRALKPKWQAPQGPEAEELVTILSFNLNRDGTLAGNPTVVRQLGITDTNRNQADRHAEQAIKAVRLAAPFNLPEEYYDAWKRVSAFRFDKRLSQ